MRRGGTASLMWCIDCFLFALYACCKNTKNIMYYIAVLYFCVDFFVLQFPRVELLRSFFCMWNFRVKFSVCGIIILYFLRVEFVCYIFCVLFSCYIYFGIFSCNINFCIFVLQFLPCIFHVWNICVIFFACGILCFFCVVFLRYIFCVVFYACGIFVLYLLCCVFWVVLKSFNYMLKLLLIIYQQLFCQSLKKNIFSGVGQL